VNTQARHWEATSSLVLHIHCDMFRVRSTSTTHFTFLPWSVGKE
jgi:hypothetical protein